ncbi:MAG: hypothetical protein IMZ50_15615 [Candidatus Atribacteria bacterium]|nr:hypothetical protein [Candidatus Atribacteria bacterium]
MQIDLDNPPDFCPACGTVLYGNGLKIIFWYCGSWVSFEGRFWQTDKCRAKQRRNGVGPERAIRAERASQPDAALRERE